MKRFARAQSVVEMALILPFLVLITLGTTELGYYIYTYSELENATRRVSEAAAKTPPLTPTSSDDALTGVGTPDRCAVLAKQYALQNVFLQEIALSDITITYPSTDPGQQERKVGVQIQATLTYNRGQWLTPLGNRFFGNNLRFTFSSRRTITSIKAPPGRNPDCSENTTP